MSPETGCKKLVLVSATFTSVTEAKKEVESIETTRASKDGKESKGENLAQVLCICYPIIFYHLLKEVHARVGIL